MEKELDEELARFIKDGPTPEELQRVKTQYEANSSVASSASAGFGGKSDRLAQSQVYRGSPDAYKISLKRVQEATAEDLRAAAQKWLSDGVYILEVDPFPEYKTAAKRRRSQQGSGNRHAAGVEAAETAAGYLVEWIESHSGGASRSAAGEFHAGGRRRICFRRIDGCREQLTWRCRC